MRRDVREHNVDELVSMFGVSQAGADLLVADARRGCWRRVVARYGDRRRETLEVRYGDRWAMVEHASDTLSDTVSRVYPCLHTASYHILKDIDERRRRTETETETEEEQSDAQLTSGTRS